eukprot:g32307.t1
MEYNVGKCDLMHFGRNRGTDYFPNGERFWKPEAQKNLGVLVQDSLMVNMQVQTAGTQVWFHPWVTVSVEFAHSPRVKEQRTKNKEQRTKNKEQ